MQRLNLSNQRFGKLFVLGIDEENKYNSSKKLLWKCQCDCGKICYKTADSLKRKPTSDVLQACSKKCGASIPIGSRFGRLVVEENLFFENAPTKSRCKCDCGKEVVILSSTLKKGVAKSCGCYKIDKMSEIGKQYSEISDISGQKFGKLTALIPTDKRQQKSVVWDCLCECGNHHLASATNLKGGSVTRCIKCAITSKGEEAIKKLLSEYNYSYEVQKTFENCRFPETNALAKFDFFVENTYLIEFDGVQHFQYAESGWFPTKEKWESLKLRDEFKNDWCKKNNIPLIRIPYTELKYLTINDLILNKSKFLV